MLGDFDERYTRYQVERGLLRRLVRKVYLRSAAAYLSGPTLDLGCGVGELLERLPKGSLGLEYNRATVDYCRSRGLEVAWYDGDADGWALRGVAADREFESLVISHVLEHFEHPEVVINRLLPAAAKLGVRRALIIVPGRAGFRIDDTHRTFLDLTHISAMLASVGKGWRMAQARYFPGDWRRIGDLLPHHELQVLCIRDG